MESGSDKILREDDNSMTIEGVNKGDSMIFVRFARNATPSVSKVIAAKIGRKYITVSENGEIDNNPSWEFEPISDFQDKSGKREYVVQKAPPGYSVDMSTLLFKTEAAYARFEEYERLRSWFYSMARNADRLNLDQLRKIEYALKEEQT